MQGFAAEAADIPECTPLARTIRRWEREILGDYRSEAVQRIGHGFRNLQDYRLRLLPRWRHLARSTRREAWKRGPRHVA